MKVLRKDIVAAARELFRDKGYAGASMQDLADVVGLRKASLYVRFPNKEALVADVIAMTLDETFAVIGDDQKNGKAAYEAVLRAIATTFADRKRCVALHLAYGTGEETPLAKASVRSFFAESRDRLAETIASKVGLQRARDLATDALARLEGATIWLVTEDDPAPLDRALTASLNELDAALEA